MADVLVNFAEGKSYQNKRKFNSLSGKYIAKFDRIIEFNFNDIDESFKKSNSKIFKHNKGLGLWVWKPYLIHKALKLIDYDDFLFYCDSSSIFIRSISALKKFMDENNLNIMPFALPFKESNWTSEGLMSYFKLNSAQKISNQLCASFIALKKSKKTVEIINDWLSSCQDYNIITGHYPQFESPELIEHRYDQSVLSMIIKSRGLSMYKDPSQYGSFPELYGKKFKTISYKHVKGNYRTIVILIRKGSFTRAIIDYIFNKIMFKINSNHFSKKLN